MGWSKSFYPENFLNLKSQLDAMFANEISSDRFVDEFFISHYGC
jgi:hypothetical protein